ncbi:hypothetical protein ACMHYJ_01900 [Castellaniella hirudinis]|uniref:hypothetical protein n=1 Tax=Castellaniella hirudinis TaxID=1144617 RepID=UPI0039C174BE
MNAVYSCARLGAAAVLSAGLAACQAPSGARPSSSVESAAVAPAGTAQASPVRPLQNVKEAADLRIFLADGKAHPGWTPVPLKPSGQLYVRADAIIDRGDLMGIQSAADQAGNGLLVLILTDQGLAKLQAATAANPGLRLALVVGQMMLAAPAYAAPIREQQLAFPVGSVHNAEIAARSVAGVR